MSRPSANDYDVLTFDCYGTLIDWGSGMVEFLQPVLLAHDAHVVDDFLLRFFADKEPAAQRHGRRYRDVLGDILTQLGERLAFTPSEDALTGFADSVGDWPVFADTVASLKRLAERFDLVIVSNVDNDLFARTAERLEVPFRHVVTAQDVGAYKPDPRMFDVAREALGDARILHVAQSLYHDIEPASAQGLDTVWIQRAREAARRVDVTPNWRYESLAEFAGDILGD